MNDTGFLKTEKNHVNLTYELNEGFGIFLFLNRRRNRNRLRPRKKIRLHFD